VRFTVIGAANVDIMSKSAVKIIHGDSNPAEVSLGAGGVALNIAVNLSRLGAKVDFITAVGADPLGDYLQKVCVSRGINVQQWIVRENVSTGVYSAALDIDGELYAAFNAMAVVESINAGDLYKLEETILAADLLVADTNLTDDALSAIFELRGGNPIMVDAVSVAKAPRISGLLSKISILKLNRAEAQELTDITLDSGEKVRLACAGLVSRGVKRVFITLGPDGACAADANGAEFIDAEPVAVQNVTGAGDAFATGVALRFRETLISQAQYGAQLAALHLRSNK